MKKLTVLLFIAVFVLGTVTSGLALFGSNTTLEGTVKSISSNMITISSQQKDEDATEDVSFEVNDQTRFDRITSLEELKEGDQVKVSFKEEGNKKIATAVAKQETTPGAGDNPGRVNYRY